MREEKSLFPPCKEDTFEYLCTVWDKLNPPSEELTIKGKNVGIIYYDKEKQHFFIGKVITRILYDKDGPAKEVEIEAFKRAATSTSTVVEECPNNN